MLRQGLFPIYLVCSKPRRKIRRTSYIFKKRESYRQRHCREGEAEHEVCNMFLVTRLVHFFQPNIAAPRHKQVTPLSHTSQAAQGFHKHTWNTGSRAAGRDSSLLPHILFMFQACRAWLRGLFVCECRRACVFSEEAASVHISWFIWLWNTLADR